MATIKENKNKKGEVVNYRVRALVGKDSDGRPVRRSATIERPEGLTPKKEEKEVKRQAEELEKQWREEFAQNVGSTNKRVDKTKILLDDFVRKHWWKDYVLDGEHVPSTISFYEQMSTDILEYFEKQGVKRLNQIDAEAVKRYIVYLRRDARKPAYEYETLKGVTQSADAAGHVTVRWSKRKDAESYLVFRRSGKQKSPRKIAEVSSPPYTDPEEISGAGSYTVKAKIPVEGERYKPSTIQHHFKTLGCILRYAERMNYIKKNPTTRLDTKDKPHVSSGEIDFLTAEQAQRFLEALESEPLYWKTFMHVLIATGLRRGEAVGLQYGDISKDALTITISRNVTMDKNAKNKLHIGVPKGKESRTVAISRRLYKILMEHKAEQERKYGALLPSAFIFCKDVDPFAPINPTEPTRWQAKFVKRHGLKDVSPHDLRHTAATLALEAGADIKEIQMLLGHRDPETTMKFYTGITQERRRETMERIESKLTEKKSG